MLSVKSVVHLPSALVAVQNLEPIAPTFHFETCSHDRWAAPQAPRHFLLTKLMATPEKPTTPEDLQQTQKRLLERYARLGADDADVASLVEMPAEEMTANFGDVMERARAERRAILLGLIWEAAQKGNVTILTWLAKVELGWADRAKRPKVTPPPAKAPNFDFEIFAAEFCAQFPSDIDPDLDTPLVDPPATSPLLPPGKHGPAVTSPLQRAVLSAIRREAIVDVKPARTKKSCTVSASSPRASSGAPSSTTGSSPLRRLRNRPSS